MELYDNPFSPYACKVRGVLYEKNAPHEKREVMKRADHAKLAVLTASLVASLLAAGIVRLSDRQPSNRGAGGG